MNSYKISIIIPVYNVEKYLNRCVESIINQTYKNIEIILVDDGSPDKSSEICDEWVLYDQRIKTIHRKNGGQSAARNTGIQSATGDFVTFVDSDDWIAPDTYEYCVDLLKNNEADSVQFNYMTTKEYIKIAPKVDETLLKLEGTDILKDFLVSSYKSGSYSVCRCLFPISAVKDIHFREGCINEDIDFKFKALSGVNKLLVSNLVKYFYFQHGETTSSGGLQKRDFDLYTAASELQKLANDTDEASIIKLAKYKVARTPFSLLCKIAYFGITDSHINKKEVISQLTKELRSNFIILLNSPLSLSRKILLCCFGINYNFANCLITFTKIFYKPI